MIDQRLKDLRVELKKQGLSGFFVPHDDEYQNEYLPPCAERLAWISGFTGSAGWAVVTEDKAALFVDGRYTLQAKTEVPEFFSHHPHDESWTDWVAQNLPAGSKLGYDPWLQSVKSVERAIKALEQKNIQFIPCAENPIDKIWKDRPSPPFTPIVPHDIRYAGRSAEEKRNDIAKLLKQENVQAAVLTHPPSLAWLLNIRGNDVPHTPLPLGFGIIYQDGTVDLFTDMRKISATTRTHLGSAVTLHSFEGFGPALDKLAQKKVRLDILSAPAWVGERLKKAGALLNPGDDPCLLPKATKNPVEIEGMRLAHQRDGLALTRLFHWLSVHAPSDQVTEQDVMDQALSFRKENDLFKDLSFQTIAGAGPNSAVVHYHSTPKTNRRLEKNSLFLLDSGAQYLDGTTDVTRTVAIGTPTPEMKDRFTRVLKGHIAIATACFPFGTSGEQLDSLARHALWQVGLDYKHGTGHGVGSYLGVHEGPQRISARGSRVSLYPGMIVSNEPGYYKTGAYGIRIESLVVVIERQDILQAEQSILGFETLTLAPIDTTLVQTDLLTAQELDWLNRYHQNVYEKLSPHLPSDVETWLKEATAPLSKKRWGFL